MCLKTNFHYFFCLCLSLWFAGAPLHCSSASSTPIEQSPSPPPSPPANESQRRLLGSGVAQPTPDSDSEEEFVPNSFLVKSGSASLGVAANGKSLSLPNFCGCCVRTCVCVYARAHVCVFLSLAMLINLPALAVCRGGGAWCMGGLGLSGAWRSSEAQAVRLLPGCAAGVWKPGGGGGIRVLLSPLP